MSFQRSGWTTDKYTPKSQLAVYPIYAPIYIAEYSLRSTDSDAKSRERRITVVMDASNEVSRVVVPPLFLLSSATVR
jgi:hypothetical protein